MSDATAVLIVLAVGVAIMAMFAPGRSVIGFVVSQVWAAALWVAGVLAAGVQVVGLAVWRSHLTVFRNLGPRVAVLPSVGTITTRR